MNRGKTPNSEDHFVNSTLQKTRSASMLCLQGVSSSSASSDTDSDSDSQAPDSDKTRTEMAFSRLSNAFQSKLFPKSPISPMTEKDNLKEIQFYQPKDKQSNSGPNIFKKMISRKALIPKLKAFKRISDELQVESSPLDDEIHHELMITSAFKTDPTTNIFKTSGISNMLLLQHDSSKRFDMINKANEAWNKNRRVSTSSLESSKTMRSNSRRDSLNSVNPLNKVRQKRRLDADESFNDEYIQDSDDGGWNHKRRLVSVSNSPILDPNSTGFDLTISRRNSVLLPSIYSASEELEMMHLK